MSKLLLFEYLLSAKIPVIAFILFISPHFIMSLSQYSSLLHVSPAPFLLTWFALYSSPHPLPKQNSPALLQSTTEFYLYFTFDLSAACFSFVLDFHMCFGVRIVSKAAAYVSSMKMFWPYVYPCRPP